MKYLLYITALLIPLRNVVEKIPNLFDVHSLGFTNLLFFPLISGTIIFGFQNQNQTEYKSKIQISLLFYLMYLILNVGVNWKGDFNTYNISIIGIKDLILIFSIYFIFSVNRLSKKEIYIILLIMLFSNFYMLTYFLRWVRWMNFSTYSDKLKIVNGTFGDMAGPNEWAAFFSTYIFMTISFIKVFKKKYQFILLGIIIGNFIVILFSYSRGSYIGFCVGIVIYTFFNKKIIGLLFIATIIFLFSSVFIPNSVLERISMSQTEEGLYDQDIHSRLDMWNAAWDGFLKAPIIGHGYKSFKFSYDHSNINWNNPHNLYLQILYERGILAFIIIVWLFYSMYKDSFYLRKIAKDQISKSVAIGSISAISSLIVANFFGNRWSYLCLTGYLWVIYGIIKQLIRINEQTGTDEGQDKTLVV